MPDIRTRIGRYCSICQNFFPMDISEAQKENMVYINERGFPVN
jgi:hypothetical protein